MSTMLQVDELTPERNPLEAFDFTLELTASHSALLKVMSHHNPDKSHKIGNFKLIFAALITEAEKIRDRNLLPETAGENPDIPNINANEKIKEGRSSCESAIGHLEIACLLMLKAVLL
jgi:hypothetical protein